jgi:diaminopimelate epimerase
MNAMDQAGQPEEAAGHHTAGPGTGGARGRLSLSKYEGLGNDFLVLLDLEGRRRIDAALARAVCDRHLGFGADGLLWAGPPQGGAAMTFELRNADGSEAEMSGNGLRCLAHAAIDAGVVSAGPGERFSVLTPVGTREVRVVAVEDGWVWASTEMGAPKISPGPALCNVGNGQAFVDVGNPHLVVLGPDPAGLDVASLGPELSAQAGGTNVEFVAVGPGCDELTMRVWERGVGETLACGTGSVAAAAALHGWGRVSRLVTVHQPGGSVEVELRPDGVALLSGPSRRVGRCWFEPGEQERSGTAGATAAARLSAARSPGER